ncbi:hypothetical protein WJU23_20800 [Prosthecobacter sp. SYSU 5D2]|uniref:hypothetical protein n=1 Tax=Prosthecobacter sp. SYSU 5D2 TaxID=3134134 RepID=UPI0031FEA06C
MSAYTQPIIRFGLITPVAFNLLLLAGAGAAVSKLSSIREVKEAQYKEQTMRLTAMKNLETSIAPKRAAFEDQKKLLKSDPGQLFTRILDGMLPKYKEIELERSSLIFPLDQGRLTKDARAESARVKSSFQGGMGPMQEALLQVESLMPQSMLEEMKVTRKADQMLKQREYLVMEMTHTCWKTTKEKP